MRFGPPVAFARTAAGSRLAYQVIGEGEHDVVFLPGWPSHLALMWEYPAFAAFLHGLASFSRLILFDRLGIGMSDRGPTGRAFEDGMDDIRTVLAAAGSERAALFGWSLGGRLALLFAATHPEQTTAVITFGSHPATLRHDDYPWGATAEDRGNAVDRRLGRPRPRNVLAGLAPSEAGNEAARRWWSTYWNSASTPPESVDEILAHGPVDVRDLLGSVRVPALVLHRTGDRAVNIEASRYMAARLPHARFVELPGEDHMPFAGDQEAILALTQEFLTGTPRAVDTNRAVLTVMFTDIVGSTALASRWVTDAGASCWRSTTR